MLWVLTTITKTVQADGLVRPGLSVCWRGEWGVCCLSCSIEGLWIQWRSLGLCLHPLPTVLRSGRGKRGQVNGIWGLAGNSKLHLHNKWQSAFVCVVVRGGSSWGLLTDSNSLIWCKCVCVWGHAGGYICTRECTTEFVLDYKLLYKCAESRPGQIPTENNLDIWKLKRKPHNKKHLTCHSSTVTEILHFWGW